MDENNPWLVHVPRNIPVSLILTLAIERQKRVVGVPPCCLYVTLDEWAQLSHELGAPHIPVGRFDGIPIMLRAR